MYWLMDSKSFLESINAQAKNVFFLQGEVFFLLTRPLMGDPQSIGPPTHKSQRMSVVWGLGVKNPRLPDSAIFQSYD
jgi:hypothetical protein